MCDVVKNFTFAISSPDEFLSNRLSNGFDNRLNVCIGPTRYNRLYRVYKHLHGCQIGLTTGLTTGCIKEHLIANKIANKIFHVTVLILGYTGFARYHFLP